MVREDRSDVIYKTEKAKFEAVVEDIAERNEAGQPVLVGTRERREVRGPLQVPARAGHPARGAQRQATREARSWRPAGQLGAVTVATNMAGRGTDIQLGGNPEFIADEALRAAASRRRRRPRSTRPPGTTRSRRPSSR